MYVFRRAEDIANWSIERQIHLSSPLERARSEREQILYQWRIHEEKEAKRRRLLNENSNVTLAGGERMAGQQ